MRQDEVIFDGTNPFLEFAKSTELTVLLDQDRFLFVATVSGVNIMMTFNSTVTEDFSDDNKALTAYTIPLTLALNLFRLDTKKKGNILTLKSMSDKVIINYNGNEVESEIYSPNGLTIQQIREINTADSQRVSTTPFIKMMEMFGLSKDNFCNVTSNKLFISDGFKSLFSDSDVTYEKQFSMPLHYIRLMKDMECNELFIGDNLVAQSKKGVWLVTSLTRVTDPNVVDDYKFAVRIPSKEIYNLKLTKYFRQASLAVKSADISAQLDLDGRKLILTSTSNEQSIIELEEQSIIREGDSGFSLFGDDKAEGDQLILKDPRLIKTLMSFHHVRIKVTPLFLIAKLGDSHKLLFSLGGK